MSPEASKETCVEAGGRSHASADAAALSERVAALSKELADSKEAEKWSAAECSRLAAENRQHRDDLADARSRADERAGEIQTAKITIQVSQGVACNILYTLGSALLCYTPLGGSEAGIAPEVSQSMELLYGHLVQSSEGRKYFPGPAGSWVWCVLVLGIVLCCAVLLTSPENCERSCFWAIVAVPELPGADIVTGVQLRIVGFIG